MASAGLGGAAAFDFSEPLDSHRTNASTVSPTDALNNYAMNAAPMTSTTVPAPVRDAQGRVLNPRSCVTCRRRKVKCDKLHPCSNCSRAHIECVFPAPGRTPRKPRKSTDPRDAELLERLRRLEGVVKRMGVDPVNGDEEELADAVLAESSKVADHEQADRPEQANSRSPPNRNDDGRPMWEEKNGQVEHGRSGFEHRFGRLVVNEGKSRYINNSFWASLSNEVEDLKGILNDDSEEEDESSPTQSSAGQHHGWVFSFSSQNVDLLSLHPVPVQIQTYWNIYKDRVDPLVKVLHIPSIEPTVLASASHLANLAKSFEALLFTIYYGAATSLSPQDCLAKLGEERSVLLSRYRFAIEQALARANFLTTEEITVLQSFVIFLICLRRNNDARVIWTLTGLVVRIAQTIGIHRDGSHFGLTPFEVETRRRLWWQVCILDVRASEDHGCDPTIVEQAFDTKMPLNVDDADLSPSMTDFPPERQGCTDMSFCLIRCEVANTFRRLNYVPPGKPTACGNYFASVTLEDKERWIKECHQRLEEKYLKHVDMTVPLFWVTATVARLMMSKMWLMVYHPFQRQEGATALSDETREKLFITSLENIEYSLLLETEARTMKWGWLFKTYVQWHALAFILAELCHRTRGELVDRAWLAVERSSDGRWGELAPSGSRSGHLWRPLMRLFAKARAARQQALADDASSVEETRAQQLQQTYRANGFTPSESVTLGTDIRPRLTRAPLSAAQLSRFMSPPTYGSSPIDTTELMKSPKLEDTILADDNVDMQSLMPEVAEDPISQPGLQPVHPPDQRLLQQAQLNAQNAAFGTTSGPSQLNFANFANAGMSRPTSIPNGEAISGNTSSAPFTMQSSSQSPVVQQGGPNFGGGPSPRPDLTGFPSIAGISSPSGFPYDAGAGSASANTNMTGVENADWDELTKHFGMDIDSNGGRADDWGGPNWNNMSMGIYGPGMNMGGGDWF